MDEAQEPFEVLDAFEALEPVDLFEALEPFDVDRPLEELFRVLWAEDERGLPVTGWPLSLLLEPLEADRGRGADASFEPLCRLEVDAFLSPLLPAGLFVSFFLASPFLLEERDPSRCSHVLDFKKGKSFFWHSSRMA